MDTIPILGGNEGLMACCKVGGSGEGMAARPRYGPGLFKAFRFWVRG